MKKAVITLFLILTSPLLAQAAASEAIAEAAAPAVVQINAYRAVPTWLVYSVETGSGWHLAIEPGGTAEKRVSSGSGFFVSTEGYLLTNKHVVADPAAEYFVDTGETEAEARVVYLDPDYDLAILKMEQADDYPALALAATLPALGDSVVAIGNALGQSPDSVSTGLVSALNQNIVAGNERQMAEKLEGLIQTSARLYPGDSGGPLLNEVGEAVGVNVAIEVDSPVSFAIPATSAATVLERAGISH